VQFLLRSFSSPFVTLINHVLGRLDSTAAIDTKPMNKALTFAFLPSRVGAAILAPLAAIGLYGVLAYALSRRIREIGLRIAVGATPGCIVRLVLRQSLMLVAVGVGAGTAMAIFLVRPLAAFLIPEVRPADPMNFFVVAVVLLLVALLATVAPAVRALRVDPVVALRHD
jgi:ABC-type antimicrobial peptide transport system permease subunit